MNTFKNIWPLLKKPLQRRGIQCKDSHTLPSGIIDLPIFPAGILETSLNRRDAPIDLSFFIDRHQFCTTEWAAYVKNAGEIQSQNAHAFERFGNALANDCPDWEWIRSLWLEFDSSSAQERVIPNLFCHPDDPIGKPATLGDRAASQQKKSVESICQVADFFKQPLNSKTLEKVLHHMPSSSRIEQFGLMLQREKEPIRLVFGAFPIHAINSFLKKIKWPGDTQKLLPVLNILSDSIESVYLHLSLSDTVHPKLDLELVPEPSKNTFPKDKEKQAFAKLLEKLGLPGSNYLFWDELWTCDSTKTPMQPESMRFEEDSQRFNSLTRSVNHIKLIVTEQSCTTFVEAKIYLAYQFARESRLNPKYW